MTDSDRRQQQLPHHPRANRPCSIFSRESSDPSSSRRPSLRRLDSRAMVGDPRREGQSAGGQTSESAGSGRVGRVAPCDRGRRPWAMIVRSDPPRAGRRRDRVAEPDGGGVSGGPSLARRAPPEPSDRRTGTRDYNGEGEPEGTDVAERDPHLAQSWRERSGELGAEAVRGRAITAIGAGATSARGAAPLRRSGSRSGSTARRVAAIR